MRAAAILFLLFGAACASRQLQWIQPAEELKTEIPKEFQARFSLEEPAPLPSASPSPSPVAGKKGKRKGKTKGAKPVAATYADEAGAPAPSPIPVRRPARDPLWPGEKLSYDVTYFGIPAGTLEVEVKGHKAIKGRKVYHVFGHAKSSDLFDLVYRLDDTIDSFIDYDGLFSHRFHLKLNESKQTRDALEIYDFEKNQAFYWNRWDHKTRGYVENKETVPIEPLSQDSLSALYFLRFVPLTNGEVVTFPVASEGRTWEAVGTVLRRETLGTAMGQIPTVVVRPQTRFRGILQQANGDSFLWFTDDDRRFLVRMEAKVRIGTVVLQVTKIEPGLQP